MEPGGVHLQGRHDGATVRSHVMHRTPYWSCLLLFLQEHGHELSADSGRGYVSAADSRRECGHGVQHAGADIYRYYTTSRADFFARCHLQAAMVGGLTVQQSPSEAWKKGSSPPEWGRRGYNEVVLLTNITSRM
jgi:hypothetical protein